VCSLDVLGVLGDLRDCAHVPKLAHCVGMADSTKVYAIWHAGGVTFFGIEHAPKAPILRIDPWSSGSTSGGQGSWTARLHLLLQVNEENEAWVQLG
jgi:hypothetical protein